MGNAGARRSADRALGRDAEVLRLSTVFEHAATVVTAHEGPEHAVVYANPQAKALLGERALLGSSLRDATPEFAGQGVFERFDKVYRTGEASIEEELCVVFHRADTGRLEEGHFNHSLLPWHASDGTIRGVISIAFEVTELVRARERVQRSDARLRFALEAGAIGTWDWDVAGGRVEWSESLEMIHGMPPRSFGGRFDDFLEDVHPDDRARVRAAITEAIETRSDYRVECRLAAKDRWVEGKGRCFYDEAGQPVRMTGICMDITDRKRAEQESERLVQRLTVERGRLLVSNAVTSILARSISLEEAAPRLLEPFCAHMPAEVCELWLPDATDGRLACAGFHTALGGGAAQSFRALTEQTAFARGEGLPGRVWQSGSAVWVERLTDDPGFVRRGAASELEVATAAGFPIMLSDACIGAMTVFMREVTSADQALLEMMAAIGHEIGQFIRRTRVEQAQRFLAAIVEGSEDAIVSATTEGIFTSWNPAAERLFGYSAEEAIGRPISLIVPEDRMDERERFVARLQRGEHVEHLETVRFNRRGERIPCSVGISALHDVTGRTIGLVAVARDVSERERAEAQIRARARQQEAVATLGASALAGADLQELLNRAAELVAETLAVEFCKILECSADGRHLLLRAGVGWKPDLVGRVTIDAGLESQGGYVLSVGEPVIVHDLSSETRFRAAPLLQEHGVTAGLSVPIAGEEGYPFGVLGGHTRRRRRFTTDDITFLQSVANVLASAIQRRHAEEQQRLLVRELSHRVKNILAVVQAIAGQTGRRAATVEEFHTALTGRLAALLSVHNLLTESTWRSVRLHDLAQGVLAPHVGGERVRFDLEDVTLKPAVAQTFALLLHELATNAMKYGALSTSSGHVRLATAVRGEELHLVWQESGGPPVEEPTHSGFGTTLICQTLEFQHRGTVKLDWEATGLVCNVIVPLAEVTA